MRNGRHPKFPLATYRLRCTNLALVPGTRALAHRAPACFDGRVPGLAGIAHIDLMVCDVARSERFYTEGLGMTRRDAVTKPSFVSVVLGRDDLGCTVGLNWCEVADGSPFDEMRTGLDHLAFQVPTRGDLDAWQDRLRDEGVPFTPIMDTPTGSVLVFRDPDNIQLELFAPCDP